MSEHAPQCLVCQQPIESSTGPATTDTITCAHCGLEQIQLAYRAVNSTPTENTVVSGDVAGASCFFHESNEARSLCDVCGRYVCSLCQISLPTPANNPTDFPETVCSECFDHVVDEERVAPRWDLFRTDYPRFDYMVALLAIVPIGIFPLLIAAPITLPLAIYLILRFWRTNRTPLGRHRFMFAFSLPILFLTALLWGTFFVFALMSILGEPL